MARKNTKDFTKNNRPSDAVQNQFNLSTTPPEPEEPETDGAPADGSGAPATDKTRKTARITVTLTQDQRRLIEVIARVRGQTMGDFVSDLIQRYSDTHQTTYKRALDLIKEAETGDIFSAGR